MNLVFFAIVLVVIAAAFAVPVLRYGERRVSDADAVVLGAAILTGGLGILNWLFLVANVFFGEFAASWLLFGLAPLAAGLLGAIVVAGRMHDVRRPLALVAAAGLTLAGLPYYFAFEFAAFSSIVAAVAFLLGMVSPRRLFQALDPRLK